MLNGLWPDIYMKIKNLVLFLFLGLIVTSCNKDANDLRILNLEGEFLIGADQELTPNGPRFSYRISTINDQECKSSEIVYTLIDQEGELNLTLEDITQIEDCPTGKGQVVESIPLSIAEGITDIAISLSNVVKYTGTIETTPLHHIMKLPNPEGILIGNTIVNRIPPQVIFGSIYDINQDPISANLLQSLSNFSVKNIIDGYYTSNFSIENQLTVINNDISTPPIHSDVSYYIEDKDAFKDFVNLYKEDHSNLIFQFIDAETGEQLLF